MPNIYLNSYSIQQSLLSTFKALLTLFYILYDHYVLHNLVSNQSSNNCRENDFPSKTFPRKKYFLYKTLPPCQISFFFYVCCSQTYKPYFIQMITRIMAACKLIARRMMRMMVIPQHLRGYNISSVNLSYYVLSI